MLTIDTREKPHAITQILQDFRLLNVPYIHEKLDVGDYRYDKNPNVIVDRKQSLNEVIGNFGNEKGRVFREMQRALNQNIKLIFLVEHGEGIKELRDIAKWENPNYGNSKLYMTGRELLSRMKNAEYMFGVRFEFCEKHETGKRILELLEVISG